MKKLFALLLVCVVSVALTKTDEDVYNPLAVGMRWEATLDLTTPDGQLLHGTAIRQITGTKSISGKTYFTSVTKMEGIPGFPEFTTYRRKTATGIYAIDSMALDKGEYLETALPLSVGKTWTLPTASGEKVSFIVERQENISVDEQRYEKCFKVVYRSNGVAPSGYFWLAPNIGNVEENLQQGGATFHFKLKSFKVGK